MSATTPAFIIPRRSVFQPAGEAGLWVKIFDPPNESPDPPERLDLNNLPFGVRANPVPEVMQAAGFLGNPVAPHTVHRTLMHGMTIPSWDNRDGGLLFFLFEDDDLKSPFNAPVYPGPTPRVPRGAVFHGFTHGDGPPPHTIHWHGIEPTPINDGVGHCSMEIGNFTYQWQPNFIGSYFYHCHRNTTQHFEFGLFGNLIIDPPDAFFASIAAVNPDGSVVLNNVPIGNGRPEPGFPNGRRRTAANLVTPFADFRGAFPGFVGGDPINGVFVPDPEGQFPTDPHAFTVPYDVEAFWVLDDRDSVWSDFAPDPRAFLGKHGNQPGINDEFAPGFFNEFHADYWFVTGVPVVPLNGIKAIPNVESIDPAGAPPTGGGLPGGVIPAPLNSGVAGTQVAVNARVNQTILIRALDAAYNNTMITFPVDVVIIAFNGRALGVPPFGLYNWAFLLPAGTPILLSTARRFDVLLRSATAVNSFATVDFLDTRGNTLLQTARIPIVIT